MKEKGNNILIKFESQNKRQKEGGYGEIGRRYGLN